VLEAGGAKAPDLINGPSATGKNLAAPAANGLQKASNCNVCLHLILGRRSLSPHYVKVTTKPVQAIDPEGKTGRFNKIQNQHFFL
jgi:hypothetical protein